MAEDARFGLARAYEAQKNSARAIALYREIAADPTGSRAAQAQLNMAARYFDDGQHSEAAAAYRQLEDRFPDHALVPFARLNAGYACYKAGDFKTAVTQCDRAARDEKQAATARYWKGLSLKPLGQFAEAADALQSAYEADSDGPVAADALFQWADSE